MNIVLPLAAWRRRPGAPARRAAVKPGRRALAIVTIAVSVAAGAAACSGSDAGGSDTPPSKAQISAALAQHARAVRVHDRAAFLDGVDDRKPAGGFRSAQDAEFANLRKLPLSTWSYTLASVVTDRGAQAKARKTFGPSALIAKVTLRYALQGVDPVPTEHELWWTFARVDGRVVICADDGLATAGGVSWRGPWDFGPITVAHSQHSLVLGEADQGATLRALATATDRAVPRVTDVWGTDWTQDVAVLVPPTAAAQAAELNETNYAAGAGSGTASGGQAEDIAAVAVSDGQDPLTGREQGQRVVVVPATFERLSPLGQQITLTHEITHVASAAATGGASPRWLVEGFAEYVANAGTGQPVRTIAAELVTQIGRSGLPSALPGDDTFGTASTAASAYEQAWLACRLIAARAGTTGLVRFYRAVGASGQSSDDAVAQALRSTLHESPSAFVAQWRTYLRAQLR